MSRSGYTDDCEYLALYRGNVERTLRGRRGQAFLRELAAALDAMPEKALIADALIDEQGDVCAMGAVCKARGMDASAIDYDSPDDVGKALGISRIMAAEIAYMNDEWVEDRTPERRWRRMREWVEKNLRD